MSQWLSPGPLPLYGKSMTKLCDELGSPAMLGCRAAVLCSLIYIDTKQFPHITESQARIPRVSLYFYNPQPGETRMNQTYTTCNIFICFSRKALLNKSALQWHLLGVSGTGRRKNKAKYLIVTELPRERGNLAVSRVSFLNDLSNWELYCEK